MTKISKRQRQFRHLFEGKKIKEIDASSINSINFYFTDGKSVCLDIDYFGNAVGYGIVPFK